MMELVLQLILNGIAIGAVYSMVALGFSLIYNATKVLHIAHGAIYTISAYLIFLTFTQFKLPLFISIPLSLIGVILLGIFMEVLIYKPLWRKNAPLITSFISSLGLYIFLQNLIALIYGNQIQVLTTEPQKPFYLGNIIISNIQLFEIITFIFIAIIFYLIFSFTKFGKLLKALSDNPLLTEVLGIDIDSLRIKTFAIGSLLAGIGGILSAFDTGLEPTMGLPIILSSITAVIVGGVNVFEGALLGGILVGILEALTIWKFSARWQSVAVFLILIIFLLFKPEGLLGTKRKLEEVRV